jgi:hypothetical protein
MADLPLHEASVGLLRHWGDARFAPPSIYFLNLGQTNQLFSLLVFFFSLAFPIGWASKLVVAGSLLTLPVAAAHFADYVRAPRWTALLVAPLGLGWLFFWGLIQNIVGLVSLMALLPALDRFAERPTGRGALAMCGAMLLLYFAHEAMQIVACAALVLSSIGSSMRMRLVALRAAPIVFCGVLVFAAHEHAWHLAGRWHRSTASLEWMTIGYKLGEIPGVLFAGYELYIRNLIMALALVPVVLFAVDRFRNRERGRRSFAEHLHRWRFELLSVVLFALYLAAPATVKSTTLVYHRFLPPAWAILAIAVASGTSKTARVVPRALCATLPVASLLVGWPTFVDSNRIYSDLEELIPRIQPGSPVMALNIGPSPRHRLWSPSVAVGHVIAVLGGRSLYDYTMSPVSPVSQRPEKQWYESAARMSGESYQLRPAWDFTRYRYLLLITPLPGRAAAATLAIRDAAVLIGHQGDWYLFESRLPRVAIDAEDAELPLPHPASLRKRLRLVSNELDQIANAGTVTNAPAGEPEDSQ